MELSLKILCSKSALTRKALLNEPDWLEHYEILIKGCSNHVKCISNQHYWQLFDVGEGKNKNKNKPKNSQKTKSPACSNQHALHTFSIVYGFSGVAKINKSPGCTLQLNESQDKHGNCDGKQWVPEANTVSRHLPVEGNNSWGK
ncbi:unnamed protein product [Ceratitis capitata]|uniref:(Mediterranean fruit fly) hypothetical protein n=1 Tax=Ceratitis capitata TaxID=7213 RepID=A0A811UPJ9_CERCA|nr:unnamed protein product [Ceratitis capitata]